MSKPIINVLDIGIRSLRVLTVRQGDEQLEFLGFGATKTEGLTDRGVTDVMKLATSIRKAQAQAEETSGHKIKNIWVNVGTARFRAINSKGLISVSRADREISEEDVKRVLEQAQTMSIPSNNEIIDTQEKEFIIDNQKGIRRPQGMKGTRLEVEALLMTVFSPYLEKIQNAVLKAGLEINDMFITPVAAAEAVLNDAQKEKGCALIDIGENLTKVVVYKNNTLVDSHIFKLGSANITEDIAVGHQVDLKEAEALKKENSCQKPKSRSQKKEIKLKRKIAKLIKARAQEILKESHNLITKNIDRSELPAGIILTGGGAKLDGLVELTKEEFKLPVQIGYPQDIEGVEQKDPSLATVVGLAKLATQDENSSFSTPWYKKIFRFFLP